MLYMRRVLLVLLCVAFVALLSPAAATANGTSLQRELIVLINNGTGFVSSDVGDAVSEMLMETALALDFLQSLHSLPHDQLTVRDAEIAALQAQLDELIALLEQLMVADTIVRNNGTGSNGGGILIKPTGVGSGGTGAINSSSVNNGSVGVKGDGSGVTIRLNGNTITGNGTGQD
jgi:hypothetical protein